MERKTVPVIDNLIVTLALLIVSGLANAEDFRGYAAIGDIRMYYELHGEGAPVLLLHGGLSSGAAAWAQIIPKLKQQYRLIVADARAHGRSTDSDKPLGYDLLADDVVALLDHLGIQAASVIGWSDGGIVGLNLALRHPRRLNKLVAYGSNFHKNGVTRATMQWTRQLDLKTFPPDLARSYAAIAPDPDHLDVMIRKVVKMWLSEPKWNTQDLMRIRTPVLIVEDRIGKTIKPEHTFEMVRAIPGAQLALIDGTDHMAPQERPSAFLGFVTGFLDSGSAY